MEAGELCEVLNHPWKEFHFSIFSVLENAHRTFGVLVVSLSEELGHLREQRAPSSCLQDDFSLLLYRRMVGHMIDRNLEPPNSAGTASVLETGPAT